MAAVDQMEATEMILNEARREHLPVKDPDGEEIKGMWGPHTRTGGYHRVPTTSVHLPPYLGRQKSVSSKEANVPSTSILCERLNTCAEIS